MSKSVLRRLWLPAMVVGLLAGLHMTSASTASAQIIGSNDPCGGTFSGTFNLTGRPTAFFVPATTTGATCVGTGSFGQAYQVFSFTLSGTGPHEVTAETCDSPTNPDTELVIYQSPTGAPNPFTPGVPCANWVQDDDDACNPESRVSDSNRVNGDYQIVVHNWWAASSAMSGDIRVSSPTCRPDGYPWVTELPYSITNPAALCSTGRATIQLTVQNTGVDTLDNLGSADEFYVDVIGAGRPATIISIASGTGGTGSAPAQLPSPNCGLEGGASVHLSLAPGQTDTITLQVAFTQGLPTGLSVNRSVFFDFDGDGGCGRGDARFQFLDEEVVALPCPPTVWPNDQLGRQVHLPILNFQGMDDVCESWIEVQNIGCVNAKAALITWGEPGFCPPQAAGPLKVECTGLLKPGSTWNLYGAQVPTGSKSGILFKLSARQLSEDGLDTGGGDDITGDLICEFLFFNVVGDADDYRRFKKAYNEGLEWEGIDLVRASAGGALAVDVHRTCPGDATPGVDVTSKYNGLAGTHLGTYDEVYGGFSYYVPLVYASAAGFNTIIYIQNGGLMCSSLEIWFKARDDCLRATICDIATLAPGETYQLDANDCVGPDFQGSAWIRSTQVMGIAVDIIGGDVLMTYVGEPGEINYTFDPTQSTTRDGNQVAFGPLIYSEYQGWDTGIQIQNLSAVFAAKVKIYFVDRSGGIITTLVDWVCPRGSQTFFLPVVFDLPGNWVGSMRAESQEWITPGGPNILAPNIVGVATLIKYNDVARTQKTEAIAYNLLPEHKIYDWQLGSGAGGLTSGIGLIAIPSVLRDLQNSGLTTEIAITNVVPKPGFTDLVIYFYDQNGLLDYICQKLNEKQVEYIDLQTWGFINDGFKGSAIISAWFWEHDVFDDRGIFLRNLVGLGAVSIERKGTHLGEDVPGDEAAGSRGIPFATTFDEDGDPILEFCFMGPAPLCPGFVDNRPKPGEVTCIDPVTSGATETGDFGTSTAPVPLFFGGCSQSGTPQGYMIGGLTGDGTPFTGRNCTGSAQSITVAVNQGTCSGGGAGLLLVGYQDTGNPQNPEPFNSGDVCQNIVSPLAFAINTVTFTVEPGYWQVLVQTNFIGQTCSAGVEYVITVN